MNENSLRPTDAADIWTIPLHGASVPLPPTADVPAVPFANEPPTADTIPIADFFAVDEESSDIGFHPRLRRSA